MRSALLLITVALTACGGAATQPAVVVPLAVPSAEAPTATDSGPPEPGPTAAPRSAAPPASSSTRPTAVPGTAIRFEGGDGSNIDQAIIVRGAKGERDGVDSEYHYLEMLYGRKGEGHEVRGQALLQKGSRQFDRLEVKLKDGQTIAVYFDITDYFGKF